MPESDSDLDPCVVCRTPSVTHPSRFDGVHQSCPRCGEFKVVGSALPGIGRISRNGGRVRLSGWIREQHRLGATPTITTANLAQILARPLPSVADRAQSLLEEAEHDLSGLGERFNVNEPRFLAATYSSNASDVTYLMRALSERGLAHFTALAGEAEILPAGYMYLDEIKQTNSASAQGFVAMWIHESTEVAYTDGLVAGVLGAGYNPLRVDKHEHINRIDDEIIKQIRGSRFLVADFTGHRGGVYFEAGYALGLNLPVFWTCLQSDMAQLHFDIRQFNCIDWTTPIELANRLASRIEAVLGPGPHRRLGQ